MWPTPKRFDTKSFAPVKAFDTKRFGPADTSALLPYTGPTFQANGARVRGGAVTLSPAWPAHASGDWGYLACFSADTATMLQHTLTVAAGFSVESSIEAVFSGIYGRLTIFSCRATSSGMGAPTMAARGQYSQAWITTVRGAAAASPVNDIQSYVCDPGNGNPGTLPVAGSFGSGDPGPFLGLGIMGGFVGGASTAVVDSFTTGTVHSQSPTERLDDTGLTTSEYENAFVGTWEIPDGVGSDDNFSAAYAGGSIYSVWAFTALMIGA